MELPPGREEPVEGHGPSNSGEVVDASDGGGGPGSEEERDSEERELDPVARLRAAEDTIKELQARVSALRVELEEE